MKRRSFKFVGTTSPRRSIAYRRRVARGSRTAAASAWRRRNVRTGGYVGRYPYGLTGTTPEMKFSDVSNNFTPAATGSIPGGVVEQIQQGTGESQRVGRKIIVKKISIKGYVQVHATNDLTESAGLVRFSVIKDKQANGAAPTIATIYEDTNINTFNALQYKGRYTVMRDIRITCQATAGGVRDTGPVLYNNRGFVPFELFIDCNIPIEYDGNAGTVADLTSNNIFIAGFSVSENCDIYYNVRVRYFDA